VHSSDHYTAHHSILNPGLGPHRRGRGSPSLHETTLARRTGKASIARPRETDRRRERAPACMSQLFEGQRSTSACCVGSWLRRGLACAHCLTARPRRRKQSRDSRPRPLFPISPSWNRMCRERGKGGRRVGRRRTREWKEFHQAPPRAARDAAGAPRGGAGVVPGPVWFWVWHDAAAGRRRHRGHSCRGSL
jgi:hypothetical protein